MVKALTKIQKGHRRKILEISYKYGLSHLGSCLSVIDLILAVYEIKHSDEKFILSGGHGGVALYTVLEKYHSVDAEKLFKKHGVHPNRDETLGIYCSTGSLGQGLPIALGMAFVNKRKNIYCIITDGECAEGSVWESFRIASENKINNLKLLVNANGYGAYGEINIDKLAKRIKAFGWQVEQVDGHDIDKLKKLLKKVNKEEPVAILAITKVNQLPFLNGVDAHYKIMTSKDYELAMEILN